ncbi:cell division protein ZapB [Spirochaetia bacterium 38H-sp]|uniref:Cell division protein ZapB n=1 Tax=Rarispira pelagica TaxID=3141764 RepID=A0ABU9UD03_9SPIR
MLTVEQIRQLEEKVRKMVEFIGKLKSENASLKERLSNSIERIENLEELLKKYKESQQEIEEGILSTLDHLNQIEDEIISSKEDSSGSAPLHDASGESTIEAVSNFAEEKEQHTDTPKGEDTAKEPDNNDLFVDENNSESEEKNGDIPAPPPSSQLDIF